MMETSGLGIPNT